MTSRVTHPFIDLRDSEGVAGWSGIGSGIGSGTCVGGGARAHACLRGVSGWRSRRGGGVSPAGVIGSFLPMGEDEVGQLRLSICTRAVAQLVRGERFRIVLALPEDRKQLPQDEARQRLRSSSP